jgi:hypothetical protein
MVRKESGHSVSRILPVLVLPLAILVAAALLVLRLHFQPPTVPAYVSVPSATAPPATPLVMRPGTSFVMDLQPLGPVQGAIGARAFLLRDDTVRPWNVSFVVARDGSVRIAGPTDALFAGVPAGEWEIAVAVGRPENLPTTARDVLRAREAMADAGAAAWHLVVERVRLGG